MNVTKTRNSYELGMGEIINLDLIIRDKVIMLC
jgi:hypothetical protein